MAKTTVGASVLQGLAQAGGVHAPSDLGIGGGDRSILGGTGRRIAGATKKASTTLAGKGGTRVVWNGDAVAAQIGKTMAQRLKAASFILSQQTKQNLSKPVLKYKGIRSNRIQVLPESRSKPGEFPRAETTRLKKDIFHQLVTPEKAVVGTTLDYGLILEMKMNRSFLRRTHQEMLPTIRKILTKKIP
jgi:hypothetical protein